MISRRIKSLVLTVFLLLIASQAFSQREANVWYFGIFAGIDFNSGTAVPLVDGQINRWEGVACLSDSLGNLLLYTDGDSVWNRSHQPMLNGFGLKGDPSSTESAIIVPYPAHDSLYYIFTIDEEGGDDGLCYSLVNMRGDGGLGEVIQKNEQLISPVSEKLTAVRHKNNTDFWIIAHGWETDSFFVYRLTPSGISSVPKIIEIGLPHSDIGLHGNNSVGYMRASPDGHKLAIAIQVSQIFELVDFDNETGDISNPVDILQLRGSPYGVEFSADRSKLYMTSGKYLFQADLSSSSASDIINSVVLIDSSDCGNFFGALQLATDGKIYLAHEFSSHLGVIQKPEKAGKDCNFDLNGFYLSGRQCRMGLPNFIPSYFLPPDIECRNFCVGDTTEFWIAESSNIDSVRWYFGDTLSGDNESDIFAPHHIFSADGYFYVQLELWKNNVRYLRHRIVFINSLPEFSVFPADTSVCTGDSVLFSVAVDSCSFLWDTGSTDSLLWAKSEGYYAVQLTNDYTGCLRRDSARLGLFALPSFSLGADTGFCHNDSILLTVDYPDAEFLWSSSDTTDSIFVGISGEYWVRVRDSLSCENYDTIFVSEFPLPDLWLGEDTVICPNDTLVLKFPNSKNLLWVDSVFSDTFSLNATGLYWAEVRDEHNCSATDTVEIFQEYVPFVSLGEDTTLCEGEIWELTLDFSAYDYVWSDGSSDNSFTIRDSGLYFVSARNICGVFVDSVMVSYKYCGDIYIPNIFTPNGDGVNDFFSIKGIDDGGWHLLIYNRWGELIFDDPNYANTWNGENYSNNVYFYILENPQRKMIFSGHVRIAR